MALLATAPLLLALLAGCAAPDESGDDGGAGDAGNDTVPGVGDDASPGSGENETGRESLTVNGWTYECTERTAIVGGSNETDATNQTGAFGGDVVCSVFANATQDEGNATGGATDGAQEWPDSVQNAGFRYDCEGRVTGTAAGAEMPEGACTSYVLAVGETTGPEGATPDQQSPEQSPPAGS